MATEPAPAAPTRSADDTVTLRAAKVKMPRPMPAIHRAAVTDRSNGSATAIAITPTNMSRRHETRNGLRGRLRSATASAARRSRSLETMEVSGSMERSSTRRRLLLEAKVFDMTTACGSLPCTCNAIVMLLRTHRTIVRPALDTPAFGGKRERFGVRARDLRLGRWVSRNPRVCPGWFRHFWVCPRTFLCVIVSRCF